MTEYIYTDLPNEVDLESGNTVGDVYTMTSGIHFDVPLSDMDNKNIEYCAQCCCEGMLHIFWTGELSAGDKDKLDVIVANNTPE